MSRRDWSMWLLAVGVALGAVVAAVGVVGTGAISADRVPDGAVATVNGTPILRTDYERALNALAADRRGDELDTAMRRRVLERLIEQELLVQRGLELELAQRDPRIRATLTDAVIGLLVARADAPREPPSDQDLRAYFAENRSHFGGIVRVRLRQLWFGDTPSGSRERARQRAERASSRLAAGAELATVASDGDEPAAPLPRGWLTLAKLQDYLGPTAAQAVAKLEPGQHAGPLRVAGGYTILWLANARAAEQPRFEQVQDQVASELRLRRADLALRRFLSERRSKASIAIAEEQL